MRNFSKLAISFSVTVEKEKKERNLYVTKAWRVSDDFNNACVFTCVRPDHRCGHTAGQFNSRQWRALPGAWCDLHVSTLLVQVRSKRLKQRPRFFGLEGIQLYPHP